MPTMKGVSSESSFPFPDAVKNWFYHLQRNWRQGSSHSQGTALQQLYDIDFASLTSAYFKQTEWPTPSQVEDLLDRHNKSHQNEEILLFYTQIYFRHAFARIVPSIEAIVDSWKNYEALFDIILRGEMEIQSLPASWAFDIVGEFAYQYQSFCQYRSKLGSKSEADIEKVKAVPNLWNSKKVLDYLQAMIRESKIVSILNDGEEKLTKEGTPLKTQLGYFALISLARIKVLMGDYYSSLVLLSPIHLGKNGLFSCSPACHVSLFYHLGFAQMMLHRFADSICSFSAAILNVARNRPLYARLGDAEQLTKLSDKCLELLAVVFVLCPGQRIDDQVRGYLHEKYGDKVAKMSKGGAKCKVFSDIFYYACPKFILPSSDIPEVGDESSPHAALHAQQSVFLSMVKKHAHVSTLRSYLKLYQSLELEKLRHFRQHASVHDTRAELLAFTQRNHQRQTILSTNMHKGNIMRTSDINAFIDSSDIIHVDDQPRSDSNSAAFFLSHLPQLHAVSHP